LPDRERLITRIRQIRRGSAAQAPAPSPPDAGSESDSVRLQALEERLNHLEQLVEALQDSVHRESERFSKRITELEAQTQPGALGIALSKDARDRGL
jgi:hypothetical protein